jgi:F420-0:gamma-glutamyl ligase
MVVRAVKTGKILAAQKTIFAVLDDFLPNVEERSVVVVTSKIVSLCENRVVPIKGTDKEKLIKQESDYFLPSQLSRYHHHFTITNHSLAAVAGIDESNGNENYILWPSDPQKSANEIRHHLLEKFKLKNLGVIISDSTCYPLRWGTLGLPLSYSGFEPTRSYIGQPDLFGRPFKVSRAGVALGLTAAAVVAMGEGREQTPMAVITGIDFVKFQDHNPTAQELEDFYIADYKDDLFEPFFSSVNWQKGGRQK